MQRRIRIIGMKLVGLIAVSFMVVGCWSNLPRLSRELAAGPERDRIDAVIRMRAYYRQDTKTRRGICRQLIGTFQETDSVELKVVICRTLIDHQDLSEVFIDPLLTDLIQSKDETVRMEIVNVLYRCPDTRVPKVLEGVRRNDPSPGVRAVAAAALERLAPGTATEANTTR